MGSQPPAWGHHGFQASWHWTRNLQAQGTAFPKLTNLSSVVVPEFLFEIHEHNDCHCKIHVDQAAADKSPQLHRKGIFVVYWQNKQTNKIWIYKMK